jgi:hypothetical protein
MKDAVVDAVGSTLGRALRSGVTDVINSATAAPWRRFTNCCPMALAACSTRKSAWRRPESGYQKLADPEVTRVVISRF